MYNQPEDIIGQYDLTAGKITKGRGNSYICETDVGTKILVPYAGSAERALFLRDFLLYLKDAGFFCEQVLLTHTGEALCEDAYGGRYICKDLLQGNECSTRSKEEMKEAAKILALYHKVSAGCPLEASESLKRNPESLKRNPESLTRNPDSLDGGRNSLAKNQDSRNLPETFRKHSKEMLRVRNFVSSRRNKGGFELRFLEYYPVFAEQAHQAEVLLAQMVDWPDLIWVHGEVNQHNIRKSAPGWHMVNFEHLARSWAMTDLAHFLRKMMEKNNWRVELGLEMVAAYDSVERIRPADRQLLYILLSYPEKFWKLSNQYAASHKPWLAQRSIEKLERLIAQESAKERFLLHLTH